MEGIISEYSHAALARRAEAWLSNSCVIRGYEGRPQKVRCSVVMRETTSSGWETPDAIGFAYCGITSVLVEAKVSRGGFFADAKKAFRRNQEFGMGRYRYFLTPTGLVSIEELPEGWGLLEAQGRSVKVLKISDEFMKYNQGHEKRLLFSMVRRLQLEVNHKGTKP